MPGVLPMTDDDILTIAKRHRVCDSFNILPRDEEIIAFARELLGLAAAEKGETVPVILDWRTRERGANDGGPDAA